MDVVRYEYQPLQASLVRQQSAQFLQHSRLREIMFSANFLTKTPPLPLGYT